MSLMAEEIETLPFKRKAVKDCQVYTQVNGDVVVRSGSICQKREKH